MHTTQTIRTDAEASTLFIEVDGLALTFSPATDGRVVGAEDGKLLCRFESEAEELAGEMRAWGVRDARAFGSAVVFWG